MAFKGLESSVVFRWFPVLRAVRIFLDFALFLAGVKKPETFGSSKLTSIPLLGVCISSSFATITGKCLLSHCCAYDFVKNDIAVHRFACRQSGTITSPRRDSN